MPIDNAPAQNAQSLLNGIDYSALIGGPLEAAIKAQAMAARSTWEFIKEVGLKDGPDGDKEAVTVSFTYVSNGQMMKLNVPILIIVPIPLIEVTEVRIDFKASINASSSQSNEESESSQLAAEASAEAKIGWGPFSLSASFKASYSSKKDSKATSDSRYSVEYTQNVSVVAGQADVPAGLATILAILSSNVTGSMPAGSLSVSPNAGGLRRDAPSQQAQFEVHLRDGGGLDVAGQDVIIELDDTALAPAFEVSQGVADLPVDFDSGSATLKTDKRGRVLFQMSLDPAKLGLLTKDKNVLHVTAKPGKGESVPPQTIDVLLSVTGVAPGPTLRVTPGKREVAREAGRVFDRWEAKEQSGADRLFYFDITLMFAKLERK